jgi:hypothetical protein
MGKNVRRMPNVQSIIKNKGILTEKLKEQF